MNDFKVGDRVEYFGPMQEKRGKTYTIKGFMSGTADVDGDPSFGPLLHNLRLITRTPDVITINRADLPEVTVRDVHGDEWLKVNGSTYSSHLTASMWREAAMRRLAMAEFLGAREKVAEEAKAAEKEAAEKLNKRRDDVARELAKKAGWDAPESAVYSSHLAETQYAIDMLIAEADRG